jgi:hypothetical protein
MVIEGAKAGLARAEREDRPDIIQVKSRFNRAVFETPRSGKLPPLTLPVYEPLIHLAAGGTVVARQSLLRKTSCQAKVFSTCTFSASSLRKNLK